MDTPKRLIVAVICLLCLSFATSAAASTGSLTATEFQEIGVIKQKVVATTPSLQVIAATQRSCRRAAHVSVLIDSVLRSCLGDMALVHSELDLALRERRCAKVRSDVGRLSCLVAGYAGFSRAFRAVYGDYLAVNRALLARRLPQACVLVIGMSKRKLDEVGSATRAVAGVLKGLRDHNPIETERYSGELLTIDAQLQSSPKNVSQRLTVCPHAPLG